MRALLRAVEIVAAYLAASFAAGCIVALPFAIATLDVQPMDLATLPFRGLAAGIMVALTAALPAAAVIYYAEVEGRRAARFYARAGALTGAVTSFGWVLLLSGFDPRGLQWPNAEGAGAMGAAIAVCACAGLVGGFTYWAIAGRKAGRLPNGRRADPQPPAGTHSPSTAASAERRVTFLRYQQDWPVAAHSLLGMRGVSALCSASVNSSWRCNVSSRKIAVVALLCAVVALAACRREDRFYEPLKLGGDVPQQTQTAR